MLNVLFVLPNLGRNGVVDSTISLAEHLTEHNMSVEILALERIAPSTRLPDEKVLITFGVAGEAMYILRKRNFFFIIEAVIRAIRRSDITVISFEMGPALWFPAVIAFLLRRPTITIVHSNVRHSGEYHTTYIGGKAVPTAIERGFRRWDYRRAKAVVCVSEGLRPVIASEVNPQKIFVLPNGIDIKSVARLARQGSNPAGIESSLPYIVGIGRLSPEKGFDILIRAHKLVIERGVEHRLIVIGEGDSEELISLLKELGVSDSVLFHGYMSNPFTLLANASLFCLPSRYEGRPRTLAEALVLVVPIIAADCVAGPRELLDGGRYGDLIEVGSIRDFADAIENHLQNPARLRKMANDAQAGIDRLSVKHCAARYARLIRSSASTENRPSIASPKEDLQHPTSTEI